VPRVTGRPARAPPKNYQRAEDLLRQGYAVGGVRDRDAVAGWLRLVCEETGRPQEARDFARLAAAIGTPAPLSPARKAKAGRNEPCPCGSGKKYRKCLFNPAGV
jgi:preprotein translocase subunit SecA